jgi:hypothetical protein
LAILPELVVTILLEHQGSDVSSTTSIAAAPAIGVLRRHKKQTVDAAVKAY